MPKATGPQGLYSIKTSEDDPINALTRIAGSAVFLLLFAVWGTTQFTESRFAAICSGQASCIKSWLGESLGANIYMPWDGFVWAVKWRAVPNANIKAIFTQEWLVLGASIIVSVALCVYLARKTLAKAHSHSDLHGSAHWLLRKKSKRPA